MPHFYNEFPEHLQEWALEQPIFFTASAPTHGKHINVSPKGLPSTTFTIFDGNHAAYLDATGSGAETIAHLYDNGRVTIMFNSFSKKPRILRLFCYGRVIESVDPRFEKTVRRMGRDPAEVMVGIRAIILLDIWKVQTACGYAVPTSHELSSNTEPNDKQVPEKKEGAQGKHAPSYLNDSFQDRDVLTKWLQNKVKKDALGDYQVKFNARSLDGLPGLTHARKMHGEWILFGDIRALVVKEIAHPVAILLGFILGLLLAIVMQPHGNT